MCINYHCTTKKEQYNSFSMSTYSRSCTSPSLPSLQCIMKLNHIMAMRSRIIWTLLLVELIHRYLNCGVFGQSHDLRLSSVISYFKTSNKSTSKSTKPSIFGQRQSTDRTSANSERNFSFDLGELVSSTKETFIHHHHHHHHHHHLQHHHHHHHHHHLHHRQNPTANGKDSPLPYSVSTQFVGATNKSTILLQQHQSSVNYIYIIVALVVVLILILVPASIVISIRLKKKKYNVDSENAHPSGVTDLGLRNLSLTRRNIDTSSFSANRSDSDSLRGIEFYELNGSVPEILCSDDATLYNLFHERDTVSVNQVRESYNDDSPLCPCFENYLYMVQNDLDLQWTSEDSIQYQMRVRRTTVDGRENGYLESCFENKRNRNVYNRQNATMSVDDSLLAGLNSSPATKNNHSCTPHYGLVKKQSTCSNEICKVDIELQTESVMPEGPILYIKESISTERLSRISFRKREISLLDEVMGELARRSVISDMYNYTDTKFRDHDLVPYIRPPQKAETEDKDNSEEISDRKLSFLSDNEEDN